MRKNRAKEQKVSSFEESCRIFNCAGFRGYRNNRGNMVGVITIESGRIVLLKGSPADIMMNQIMNCKIKTVAKA